MRGGEDKRRATVTDGGKVVSMASRSMVCIGADRILPQR